MATFDLFFAWRKEIRREKEFRVKTMMLQDALQAKERKEAVRLWHGRMRSTCRYQGVMRRQITLRRLKNLTESFSAWQHHNKIQKDFARSMSNLANKVDLVFKARVFATLKETSETNNTR
jgi:hypothetical protein